jgi:hypothetical protein
MMEGHLSIRESFSLWLHNLHCEPCRRFAEQTLLLAKVMPQIPECSDSSQLDLSLSPEALKRIKRAIKKACS